MIYTTYEDVLNALLKKMDVYMAAQAQGARVKPWGVVQNLTDREGEKKPFAEVLANKEESTSVVFDDLFDLQYFYRVAGVNGELNTSRGYGSFVGFDVVFLLEAVFSAKHKIFNQRQLINMAITAVALSGASLRRVITDIAEIERVEFTPNSYHMETHIIKVEFEFKKTIINRCPFLC